LISEDLRNSAPPDILYEDALFIFGGFAAFRIESVRKLDGREVIPALLFERTLTERILRADAIIVRV
jgi:hypothetical protein